jgi:hypothetical protein
MHRVGRFGVPASEGGRRCMAPEEMRGAGMGTNFDKNGDGWWTTEDWNPAVKARMQAAGDAQDASAGSG